MIASSQINLLPRNGISRNGDSYYHAEIKTKATKEKMNQVVESTANGLDNVPKLCGQFVR